MRFIEYTESRSPELAEYIRSIAATPLAFDGPHPLQHSSHNHVHLWKIEYLSDSCDWIDTDFRIKAVNFILEQWRRRLKGLPPFRERGYRIYVYEDLAPTISVVAQTDVGFPYDYGQAVMVPNIRDIMRLYENRSWKQHFQGGDWEVSEKRVLSVITKQCGSISKPSADQLGLSVGKLRTLIVNMGLGCRVNSIRKQFHRRPADFTKEAVYSDRWHVFERILPAQYQ